MAMAALSWARSMAIGKGGNACSWLGSLAAPPPAAAPTPPPAPLAALAPEPPAPWPPAPSAPPLTGAKAAADGSVADWALPPDALLAVPELRAPGAPASCLARSSAKRLMSWPWIFLICIRNWMSPVAEPAAVALDAEAMMRAALSPFCCTQQPLMGATTAKAVTARIQERPFTSALGPGVRAGRLRRRHTGRVVVRWQQHAVRLFEVVVDGVSRKPSFAEPLRAIEVHVGTLTRARVGVLRPRVPPHQRHVVRVVIDARGVPATDCPGRLGVVAHADLEPTLLVALRREVRTRFLDAG